MDRMLQSDIGRGSEGVGTTALIEISERPRYKTLWTIDRYDSDVHATKVSALKKRLGEMLVLANYHRARGDRRSWFHYVSEAGRIERDIRAHAINTDTIPGNLLLNEGIDEAWLLVLGSGGTPYNNANAQLGVGDSTVAEAATQTDLQATTNKLYKGMNAGYPTSGTQKATWQSDFTSTEANYAWQEFSLRNGATADKNLNRKVSAQGTKASGQTWTLTLDITLS